MLIKKCINIFKYRTNNFADPSGRAVWGVVARLLRFRAGILQGAWISVCYECCQVEVSATGRSFVRRSPTHFVLLNVIRRIKKPPCLQWMDRRGQTKREKTNNVDESLFEILILTHQNKKLRTFMKPEAPLPYVQMDRILSQLNPADVFRHCFRMIHFNCNRLVYT